MIDIPDRAIYIKIDKKKCQLIYLFLNNLCVDRETTLLVSCMHLFDKLHSRLWMWNLTGNLPFIQLAKGSNLIKIKSHLLQVIDPFPELFPLVGIRHEQIQLIIADQLTITLEAGHTEQLVKERVE